MKDYYAVLGVSPDAELEVISAAYKALARKYHPDTNPDSDRMQLINEAYEVLSSPTKKKSYDTKYRQYSKSGGYSGGKFDDYESSASDDSEQKQSHEEINKWNLIVEIYPNAEKNLKDLQQISSELAARYRHSLINKKLAHQADQIAQNLEQKYLERYFGSNLELQTLGKKLILSKDKKRALKINQLLKSLGEGSSDMIRQKILDEITKENLNKVTRKRQEFAKKAREASEAMRESASSKQKNKTKKEDENFHYYYASESMRDARSSKHKNRSKEKDKNLHTVFWIIIGFLIISIVILGVANNY